jgi:hypothetical protein
MIVIPHSLSLTKSTNTITQNVKGEYPDGVVVYVP